MVHSYARAVFFAIRNVKDRSRKETRSYRWWAPGIKVEAPRIEQLVVTKAELLKAVPIIPV
jgi:hypothetical protein